MKSDNNLLFIGKDDEEENAIMESLERKGWSITRVHSIDTRKELSCIGDHDIGILCLEPEHLEDSARVENLLNSLKTRLIAVATHDLLAAFTQYHAIGRLFFGYHIIPVDTDRVHHSLENLLSIIHLEKASQDPEHHQGAAECQMIGESPVMKGLFKCIHKVAAVDAPVLIQGESGTGKELAAKAIHRESSRSESPFNAINCGALPANLIQSELFGHEKGAFTGATQRKLGIIEHTDGGTLFLDEIGDLPLEMQVNLLRFLENSTIQRVGGLKEIVVNLRVLAATHVDLEQAVKEGKFREDLYHRLNVLQVQVPPLKERGADIVMLAHYFFNKFSADKPFIVNGFSKESLAVMQGSEWPGNIRELINRVRRAMVMSEHSLIRPTDLGLERRHSEARYASSLEEARDMAERSVIMASLTRNAFNILHAARELGISRVTLYRLMEKHKVHRHEHHKEAGSIATNRAPASPNVLSFTPTPKGRNNL